MEGNGASRLGCSQEKSLPHVYHCLVALTYKPKQLFQEPKLVHPLQGHHNTANIGKLNVRGRAVRVT